MTNKVIIGCDESLKGDTFGGIVLSGFFISTNDESKLEQLSITDSKKINDHKIELIFQNLNEKYNDNFYVSNINAKEYNNKIKQQNLTQLMNNEYIKIINKLIKKIKEKFSKNNNEHKLDITIVVDEYPGSKALLNIFPEAIITTKAELKYIQVAAASVVSRHYALQQINDLTKETKIIIPKGSTHVQGALNYLVQNKFDLSNYAKMNFKNVLKIYNKHLNKKN